MSLLAALVINPPYGVVNSVFDSNFWRTGILTIEQTSAPGGVTSDSTQHQCIELE